MKRFLAVLAAVVLVEAPSAAAWTWPVDGPVLRPFVFGTNPYAAGQHRGIDIGASPGTTVVAAAAGNVSFVGSVPSAGRAVTVQTPGGLSVTYLELGDTQVVRGAHVAEGEPIGTIGTAAHLHFGIRVTSDPHGYLDPLAFLPAQGAALPREGPEDAEAAVEAVPEQPVQAPEAAAPSVAEGNPVEAAQPAPDAEPVSEPEREATVVQRPDAALEPAASEQGPGEQAAVAQSATAAPEAAAPEAAPPEALTSSEPVPELGGVTEPTPVLEPAPVPEPVPVPEARPAEEPAPVPPLEPLAEPEPAAAAEPAAEAVHLGEAEPLAEPEPVADAEPVAEAEPVSVGPTPVGPADVVPESAVAQEAATEPAAAIEPVAVAPEAAPLEPVPPPAPVHEATPVLEPEAVPEPRAEAEPEPLPLERPVVVEAPDAQEPITEPAALIEPPNTEVPAPLVIAESAPAPAAAESRPQLRAELEPRADSAGPPVSEPGSLEANDAAAPVVGDHDLQPAADAEPEPPAAPKEQVVMPVPLETAVRESAPAPVVEVVPAGALASTPARTTETPNEPETAGGVEADSGLDRALPLEAAVEVDRDAVAGAAPEAAAEPADIEARVVELVDETVIGAASAPELDSIAAATATGEAAEGSKSALPNAEPVAVADDAEAASPAVRALEARDVPARLRAADEPVVRAVEAADVAFVAAGAAEATWERGSNRRPEPRASARVAPRPLLVPAQAVQRRDADAAGRGLGAEVLLAALALLLRGSATATRRGRRPQPGRPAGAPTTGCPLGRRPARSLIHGCARASEPARLGPSQRPRPLRAPLRPRPRPRRTVVAETLR